MALIQCPECGKDVSDSIKNCPHCGFKLKKSNGEKKNGDNKKLIIILSIVLFVLVAGGIGVGIAIHNHNLEIEEEEEEKEERYNKLPVKLDISMTNYYGSIDYILLDLGLDFDLVTKGANCYTGTQYGEFDTEKYGKLHTEFRYCKSNSTTIFRVYNSENDQKLREPKNGEVPSYDSYGNRKNSA